MSSASPIHLLDTNSIIESVRVGAWNALTGRLEIQTVLECSEADRAALLIRTDASSLDQGELDLYAHALARTGAQWWICSPDHASVKVGVALGWQDRLISLEELVDQVGARPRATLRQHFTKRWLSQERTKALLGP